MQSYIVKLVQVADNEKGENPLAAQTASWPQREWLARLLYILAVSINPALRLKLMGSLKYLGSWVTAQALV